MVEKIRKKAAGMFYRLACFFQKDVVSIQSLRVNQLYKENLVNPKWYDHDYLQDNSIVFDLGGYEGKWAEKIFEKYQCNIIIFEPHCVFAEKIKEKFLNKGKVKTFSFGLANENASSELFLNNNSSSLFLKTGIAVEIKLIKASDFCIQHNIKYIDLMKINIEGAEFDLLEHLIESGWINKIENIQVQFHDFVPDAYRRMARIQDKLELTHQLTYQYLFVWENWRLKSKTCATKF